MALEEGVDKASKLDIEEENPNIMNISEYETLHNTSNSASDW